jgi:hypothetical protein
MKPRLPSFPFTELTRISYGERFVAERLQLLKRPEQSMQASDSYKNNHHKKAKLHDLVEGNYALLDNQLFLGKNKKIAQRWIGLYLVTKMIHYQYIELQISANRRQIH